MYENSNVHNLDHNLRANSSEVRLSVQTPTNRYLLFIKKTLAEFYYVDVEYSPKLPTWPMR